MKKQTTLVVGALISGLCTACLFQTPESGKGDSADKAMARFQMRIAPQPTGLAKSTMEVDLFSMSDLSGLKFTVKEARINVKKIKLETGEFEGAGCSPAIAASDEPEGDASGSDLDCPEEEELTLRGPFVVDLLTGLSQPSLDTLSVPARAYKEVEIKLDDARDEDGIAENQDDLIGNTLLVKGTFGLPGQVERPFVMALNFDAEIEIESAGGLALDAAGLSNILISLKLEQWLANLDLQGCLLKPDMEQGPGREIMLSEESSLGKCLDIESTVKENIKRSFEVEEDDDGDGREDHEEDDKESKD